MVTEVTCRQGLEAKEGNESVIRVCPCVAAGTKLKLNYLKCTVLQLKVTPPFSVFPCHWDSLLWTPLPAQRSPVFLETLVPDLRGQQQTQEILPPKSLQHPAIPPSFLMSKKFEFYIFPPLGVHSISFLKLFLIGG